MVDNTPNTSIVNTLNQVTSLQIMEFNVIKLRFYFKKPPTVGVNRKRYSRQAQPSPALWFSAVRRIQALPAHS